jgi:hypothetical protein
MFDPLAQKIQYVLIPLAGFEFVLPPRININHELFSGKARGRLSFLIKNQSM